MPDSAHNITIPYTTHDVVTERISNSVQVLLVRKMWTQAIVSASCAAVDAEDSVHPISITHYCWRGDGVLVFLHVQVETGFLDEAFTKHSTFHGFLSRVAIPVVSYVVCTAESPPTDGTLVSAGIRVYELGATQGEVRVEDFVASLTREGLFPDMHDLDMPVKVRPVFKHFLTLMAFMFFQSMNKMFVSLQSL